MDIAESFARVKRANRNVADIVAIDSDNHIIRSLSGNIGNQINSLVHVIDQCRTAFKENDELTFLKIRTKRREYLVVPDEKYMLIVLLNPADESLA